jgi:hypothetical protein
MENKDIDQLIALILQDAEKRRKDAGFAGEWGDGGANELEQQVRFYQYGQKNEIPPAWSVYAQKLDPEWNEYIRLKEKFKNT